MSDEKKMYFSTYEILNVEDTKDGYKRVELKNTKDEEDHIKVDMPEWELNACATEEPTTDSDVRNLSAIYVVDKIYDKMLELDVRMDDVGYIVQKLMAKIQGEEKNSVLENFGVEYSYDVRLKRHIDNK